MLVVRFDEVGKSVYVILMNQIPDSTADVNVILVGYSDLKPGQKKLARSKIKNFILQIESETRGKIRDLISGYTDYGVPALGYEFVADREGWVTTGITAGVAINRGVDKKPLRLFNVDRAYIEVEHNDGKWGSESPVLESQMNSESYFIRVGGGRQARAETEAAKEKGCTIFEYELPIDEESKANWGNKKNSLHSA